MAAKSGYCDMTMHASNTPIPDLAHVRSVQALEARRLRTRAAAEAVGRVELYLVGSVHAGDLDYVRRIVAAERKLCADGSNEGRYAATGAALEALGRLWACG